LTGDEIYQLTAFIFKIVLAVRLALVQVMSTLSPFWKGTIAATNDLIEVVFVFINRTSFLNELD